MVAIISSFVRGWESNERFARFRTLEIVNGNLLEVSSKVADFIWDIISESWGRSNSEYADEDALYNESRMEPYKKPNLTRENELIAEEKEKLEELVQQLRDDIETLER